MSAAALDEATSRNLRTAMFAALAAYIAGSPFLVQVAGFDLAFVRPWIMFKEVGIGVLKGEFAFTSKDGATTTLTPLEILGLERYPVHAQTYRFKKLVFEDRDLGRFAADFCAKHQDDYAGLSFRGRVGSGASWRTLQADDICGTAGR